MLRYRKDCRVRIGDRFRPIQNGARDWQVEYLYTDPLGIPHVRLYEVGFPASKRTIAAAILDDRSRYCRLTAPGTD